ncbi:MAG: hypothetical protein LLG97_19345 [Deltaproteobacteria bacterium]|nr:hypothetical protein [Deltaproteobacteria bacterium]
MPLELSSVAVQEKNKLATTSVVLRALEITIPGVAEPVRVVENSANITWKGQTWVSFPFRIEEIGDHAKGEVPRVVIKVANVGGAMGNYIRQYDLYNKANGYSPILVSIFVINTLAIAVKSVSGITRAGATATATCAAHRFTSGQSVYIAGANQGEYNGLKTVTVTGTNTFTFAVTGTPATPATGTITAQLATPEVEYELELKQPQATKTWATFTLGASNPFIRRFPQAMILKNHCRFRFTSTRCGYAGAETACNHTLARCRALANSPRFGGAPGVGSAGFSVE